MKPAEIPNRAVVGGVPGTYPNPTKFSEHRSLQIAVDAWSKTSRGCGTMRRNYLIDYEMLKG